MRCIVVARGSRHLHHLTIATFGNCLHLACSAPLLSVYLQENIFFPPPTLHLTPQTRSVIDSCSAGKSLATSRCTECCFRQYKPRRWQTTQVLLTAQGLLVPARQAQPHPCLRRRRPPPQHLLNRFFSWIFQSNCESRFTSTS
jgi:hypothetical protein